MANRKTRASEAKRATRAERGMGPPGASVQGGPGDEVPRINKDVHPRSARLPEDRAGSRRHCRRCIDGARAVPAVVEPDHRQRTIHTGPRLSHSAQATLGRHAHATRFWKPRIATNAAVTIPFQIEQVRRHRTRVERQRARSGDPVAQDPSRSRAAGAGRCARRSSCRRSRGAGNGGFEVAAT